MRVPFFQRDINILGSAADLRSHSHYLAKGHFLRADVYCREAQAATSQLKDTLFNHFSGALSSNATCSITPSSQCASVRYRQPAGDMQFIIGLRLLFWLFAPVKLNPGERTAPAAVKVKTLQPN